MTEYVKFSPRESLYGDKNILHVELELLKTLKRVKNYRQLRKEEFVLKFALKQRMDEIEEQLKLLDKLLPHDKLPGLDKTRKPVKKDKEQEKEDKEKLSLDQELEVIRRRLAVLEH